MTQYHLAQVNIGRLLGPIDSELLADFVAQLEPINKIADGSPGFVWRLQTEDGNATSIRPYQDDMLAINMSVWESLEALGDYVFRGPHVEVMRQRRKWFEKMAEAYMALWWVPAGHIPSTDEAIRKLEVLRRNGPTPEAFTFHQSFSPPDALEQPSSVTDDWLCPA
jgi:hypothetical protein